MCFDLFDHSLCIQSINGSYITLIPKVPNPETVSDYRPISMLNSSIKLITKILSNRVQKGHSAIDPSKSIWVSKE
jgi:hypothetical protein